MDAASEECHMAGGASPMTTPSGLPWEVIRGITCVVCPGCAFTFAAEHTDEPDGTAYSCPCCGYGQPEPTEEELERNGEREDAEMIRDCLAQGYAEGRRDAEIEDRERDL